MKKNYLISVAIGTGLNTIFFRMRATLKKNLSREMTKKGRFNKNTRELPGVLKKIQNMTIHRLNQVKLKRSRNYFIKRKQIELLFVQELAGMCTGKGALSTF